MKVFGHFRYEDLSTVNPFQNSTYSLSNHPKLLRFSGDMEKECRLENAY